MLQCFGALVCVDACGEVVYRKSCPLSLTVMMKTDWTEQKRCLKDASSLQSVESVTAQ